MVLMLAGGLPNNACRPDSSQASLGLLFFSSAHNVLQYSVALLYPDCGHWLGFVILRLFADVLAGSCLQNFVVTLVVPSFAWLLYMQPIRPLDVFWLDMVSYAKPCQRRRRTGGIQYSMSHLKMRIQMQGKKETS